MNVHAIMGKLSAINGILQMLSCMKGCTITDEASSLLMQVTVVLGELGDELMEYTKEAGK